MILLKLEEFDSCTNRIDFLKVGSHKVERRVSYTRSAFSRKYLYFFSYQSVLGCRKCVNYCFSIDIASIQN